MLLGHRRLAAWYHQLAQHLEAGLPLAAAFRSTQGTGAPTRRLEAMAGRIEAGGSAADALRMAGSWLPLGDILALTAAAEAGRMPRTLHTLAARHERIGAAKLRIALACAYPLAILHFGLLLLPLMRMIDWEKGFHWSAGAYAQGLILTLLPLWIAALAIWSLARRGNPILAKLVALLPALGAYARRQALADFAFALGNFLDAGVPIARAWAAAGLITRASDLKTAAKAIEAAIQRGEAPGRKLEAWPCFPPDFVALYRTGEATGQLDANLLQIAAHHQDAANRALTVATVVYPLIMFLLVAATVAYLVISIYAGYLKMLGKLAE
jgi:general secretion pathway protein F/type IV pilus assembly protein PilC